MERNSFGGMIGKTMGMQTLKSWIRQNLGKSNRRAVVSAAIGAVLYGLFSAIGWKVSSTGFLNPDGASGWVSLGIETLLTVFVFFALLLLVLTRISRSKDLEPSLSPKGFWGLPPLRRKLTIIGSFAAVWVIYWLFFWPGVVSNDSEKQIVQALGYLSYSDHHPIAQTLAIEFVLRPALAIFGDINFSLGIVTLVQMLVLAAIFGLCVDSLRELKLPSWLMTTIFVFLLLHPLTGWYSVTMWKDVWLAAFVLVMGTASTLMVNRSRQGQAIHPTAWVVLFISIAGTLFAKKTGIYVVVPMLVVSAFFFRRVNLVKWVSTGIIACLFYFAGHAAIMTVLHVKPGSPVEALSMPAQQIARVVKYEGKHLSTSDKQKIKEFFPEGDLAKLYKPRISDPVKAALNPVVSKTTGLKFFQLWVDLGKKFPGVYTDAALNMTYGYWYPDVSYWLVKPSDWVGKANELAGANPETAPVLKLLPSSRIAPLPYRQWASDELNGNLRHIPILSWALSVGAWFWAAVFLGLVALVKRQKLAIPALVLVAMVWVSCLLSPVFAEARYAYPILLLLPLLGATAFVATRESKYALS